MVTLPKEMQENKAWQAEQDLKLKIQELNWKINTIKKRINEDSLTLEALKYYRDALNGD